MQYIDVEFYVNSIDEDVVPATIRPMFDKRFEATVEEQGWKDVGNPMIFEQYLDPYLLMYNMWNISYDDWLQHKYITWNQMWNKNN